MRLCVATANTGEKENRLQYSYKRRRRTRRGGTLPNPTAASRFPSARDAGCRGTQPSQTPGRVQKQASGAELCQRRPLPPHASALGARRQHHRLSSPSHHENTSPSRPRDSPAPCQHANLEETSTAFIVISEVLTPTSRFSGALGLGLTKPFCDTAALRGDGASLASRCSPSARPDGPHHYYGSRRCRGGTSV